MKSNVTRRSGVRQLTGLAAFMSLVSVVALLSAGCNILQSGQTENGVSRILGSTHQDHALKVIIDSLCWSWKSEGTPADGETGAFSVDIEATVKNEGKCKLGPPIFSVDGGGVVSRYQAAHMQDISRGKERKLRIDNGNQVHLEFNDNDPGQEILLTVRASDQWGELYGLSIKLPPPLQMPVCSE